MSDNLRMAPIAAVVAGAVALVIVVMLATRRPVTRRAEWGAWPDDERDMTAIARYFHARSASDAAGIDVRTWIDLTMDRVFRLLDRTESLVGQQLLYSR